MKVKTSAVILSGGKNSRMNYNTKAFLSLDNERFIEKIIKRLNLIDDISFVEALTLFSYSSIFLHTTAISLNL